MIDGRMKVKINKNSCVFVSVLSVLFVLAGSAAAVTGDLNGDAYVDIADLEIFANNWLGSGPGDFNSDGDVDFSDFALLAGNWLSGGRPSAGVQPSELNITIAAGESDSRTLVLSNSGEADLDYTVVVKPAGVGEIQMAQSGPSPDVFSCEHAPDRLIVKLKKGVSCEDPSLRSTSFSVERSLIKIKKLLKVGADSGDVVLVRVSEGIDLKTARDMLLANPDVLYAQPDYKVKANAEPNDTDFARQWPLKNTGQTGGAADADIDAPEAWDICTGSGDVVVGVIDTGIDYAHPDLAANIWTNPGEIPANEIDDDGNGYIDDIHGYDFFYLDGDPLDDYYHGTHVAGTIAAAGNNGRGIAGVNWNLKLMALKFLDGWGSGYISDAVTALAYADAMGATITNNSWGCDGCGEEALRDAIYESGRLGNLFVASAGNEGLNNDTSPSRNYPSSYDLDNIIAVAASDHSDQMPSWSCYGPISVDLAAPGVAVYSTTPTFITMAMNQSEIYPYYWNISGTSMAAPHVTGTAALLKSYMPLVEYQQIKTAILGSAEVKTAFNGKMVTSGRLNAYQALRTVSPPWISVTPKTGTVAAGQNRNIMASLNSNNMIAGTYSVVIDIETNDPVHPVLTVNADMTVQGIKKLSAVPSSIDFGQVQRLSQKTAVLTLTNSGNEVVTVSSMTIADPNFAHSCSLPLMVPAFKSVAVNISVTPSVTGFISSTLNITSDAADHPYLAVNMSAECVPVPVAAGFEASATIVNSSVPVVFTDASTGDITSWDWTFGDGNTSAQQSPSHSYASVGSYTVSLTVSGPGGTDTETKNAYITVSNASARLSAGSVAFDLESGGAADSNSVILYNDGTSSLDFNNVSIAYMFNPEAGSQAASGSVSVSNTAGGIYGSANISEKDMFKRPHAAGRLIVGLKQSLSAKAGLKTAVEGSFAQKGVKIKRYIKRGGKTVSGLSNAASKKGECVLTETACKDLAAVRRKLLKDPNVEYVEPDYEVKLQVVPNDEKFSELWGMNNTGQTGGTVDADIDAPEAWDIFTGVSCVLVGVIDTGIDYTHPDLADNVWTNPAEIPGNGLDDDGNGYIDDVHGWDFHNRDGDPMDDHSHGTHCSGTIAGRGNNSIGVAGVCWKARLAGLKFISANGSGYNSNAVEAIEYATANGIRITSNSWGGGGYSQSMKDAIDAAGAAGGLFIAAAGNDTNNNDAEPSYPASYTCDNIIAVAAADHKDTLAWFSNWGKTSVDLAAPGVSILSTVINGGYAKYSGTSMATPHVAGVAALLRAYSPNTTVEQIKAAIMTGTDPIPALADITVTGGRLNACKALLNTPPPIPPWLSVSPGSGSVAASGSRELVITADPNKLSADTYTAIIKIATNDPAHPLLEITAAADVTGDMSLTTLQTMLDYGETILGRSYPMSLTLKNNGTAPTTVSSIDISNPAFTHNAALPLVVQPSVPINVSITFTAGAIGTTTGAVTVNSNAQDNPQIVVDLLANVARWDNFTKASTSNGLPSDSIRAIELDAAGKAWIGTYMGGVAAFDGTSWQTYKTAEGLVNGNVWDIAIDIDQNKWIATEGGVSRFDGTTFTNYTQANGMSYQVCYSIAVDSDEFIWMGTYGDGVNRLDTATGQWQYYRTSNSPLPNNRVWDIAVDLAGNIWFATEGGVAMMDAISGNWTVYTSQLPNLTVRKIAIAGSGDKWFATAGGIARLAGTSWTVYNESTGMPEDSCRAIDVDYNNNVWVGTAGGGLCRLSGSAWTQFTTANSPLLDNTIWAVNAESPYRIWLGTGSKGVYLHERAP